MKIEDIPDSWRKSKEAVWQPINRVSKKGTPYSSWQKHPIVKCDFCHVRYVKTDPRNKTCSLECRSTYLRGSLTHTWKGGRVLHRGYVFVYLPEHPLSFWGRDKNYALEHRVVMSNHLGRIIKKTECVHHKNENRSDNRIENLELMSRAKHASLHRKKDMHLRKRNSLGQLT